jgi:origin recognition complex subunit 3
VEDDESESPLQRAFITHLFPSECTNIMLSMKALIGGFTKHATAGIAKRGVKISLANYDIEFLAAWYATTSNAHGTSSLTKSFSTAYH